VTGHACQKFSKVSALAYITFKATTGSTFENLYREAKAIPGTKDPQHKKRKKKKKRDFVPGSQSHPNPAQRPQAQARALVPGS
jgi:hypothetical protein